MSTDIIARGMAARAIAIAEAGGGGVGTADAVPFAQFGGTPNRSASQIRDAYDEAVDYIQANAGSVLAFGAGTYDFSLINAQTLTSAGAHVTMVAATPGAVVLDGTGSASPRTLFVPKSQGFTFRGITTKNLRLCASVDQMDGDIPLIQIEDWDHIGSTLESAYDLRSIYIPGTKEWKVNTLILQNIRGKGSLCGVDHRTAVEHVFVEGFRWKDIVVPDTDDGFEQSDNSMKRHGRAVGLRIGEEGNPGNDAGALLTKTAVISGVSIYNIDDQRVSRKPNKDDPLIPDTANCDGIRLCLHNVVAGPMIVNGVKNTTHMDCDGMYLKAGNSVFSSLTLIDCGYYEGMLVVKGNTYGEGGSGGVIGGPTLYPSVIIKNTRGFVGNPAISIFVDDAHFGQVYIEGAGGDVENTMTPGNRYSGTSGVISCSNDLKKRLIMERVTMRNIVVGNQTGVPARVFSLDGFSEVDIGEWHIDGLSNAGYFSTQSPGGEVPVNIFDLAVSQNVEKIRIGRGSVANVSLNGKNATAINIRGSSTKAISKLQLDDWDGLSGVRFLWSQSTGLPIGLFQVNNCDLSGSLATTPTNTIGGMNPGPTIVEFNNVKPWNVRDSAITGAVTLGTGWADSGGGVYTHATGSTGNLDFPITVTPGTTYVVGFTISGASTSAGDNVTVTLEGGTSLSPAGAALTSDNTRWWFITPNSGNNVLRFAAGANFNGTVSAIRFNRAG